MMVEVASVTSSEMVPSDKVAEVEGEVLNSTELNTKTNGKLPVFWCEACCTKLTTPTQAISHFNGKSHKSKLNQKEQEVRKRALSESEGSGENRPSKKKKSKAEPEEPVTCEDCGILLNSALMQEQHFKGKKHLSTLAKKEAAKNLPPETTVVVPEAIAKTHFCECCQVLLNSDEQAQQHVNGQRHKVKAGIIVKKPPVQAPSSNPPRGGGGGRWFGNERGRGGRGFNSQYRGGGGRGWVKATGESDNPIGGNTYSGPGIHSASNRGRGRGVNRGFGSAENGTRGRGAEGSRGRGNYGPAENGTRGRGAESSRGRGNYSRGRGDGTPGRGRGDGTPGRGHSGAYRGFETRGRGSAGRGYSNMSSQPGYGNSTGWESGSTLNANQYSSYNSEQNPQSQEKSYGGYLYNEYGTSAPQQNYNSKPPTSDAKPTTTGTAPSTYTTPNTYSSNGYSTAGYYEQNPSNNSYGSNGSQYAHNNTPNTTTTNAQSYYYGNNDYNKDTSNYGYGSYEQKQPQQPQYQNTDATYDAYYASY